MSDKLLLTSFQTWLPHQSSNSSDDLLAIIQEQIEPNHCLFLRKLPVNTELATGQVVKTIQESQPKGIICCGMAESRRQLSVESKATYGSSCNFTRVNLTKLIACLKNTKISYDAGKFVCEGLYYQILKYIQTNNLSIPCIFVHIPIINSDNANIIQHDFNAIIGFMLSSAR